MESSISYVAKGYYRESAVAESYDKSRFSSILGRLAHRLETRSALKLLTKSQDAHEILDAPCGTARLAKVIIGHDNKTELVGADISLSAIRAGRKKLAQSALYRQVNFVNCDIEQLPFRANSFDAIVCMRLMSHLPPDVRHSVLRQLIRSTRKCVIAEYQDPATLKGIWRALMGRKDAFWFPISASDPSREMESVGLHDLEVGRILGRVAESYFIMARKKIAMCE